MKISLTNYIIENLLFEDTEWKQHFLVGSKGMPKTNPDIINYVEKLYKVAYAGEADYKVKLNMAKWLIQVIEQLLVAQGKHAGDGVKSITPEQTEKFLTIVKYAKEVGGEGKDRDRQP